jgi:hypothetical protein
MDDKNIEWVSPEIKNFYVLFNKLYTKVLMNKYPFIKKIYIDPESFNAIFLNDTGKWNEDVDVVTCCDYVSDEYDTSKLEGRGSGEMGTDSVKFMVDLIKMLPNSNEVLQGKKIYPRLINNVTEHCEGIVPYHYPH